MDILLKWMLLNNKRDVDVYTKLKVSKQTFNGWKKRGSIPKAQELPISEMMGVSLQYLKTGKDDMQPKAIQAAHYTYIDAAASVPEFEAKAEEARAIFRTLSLHKQHIDADTIGELNQILNSLVMTFANIEHESRELPGTYTAHSDNEAELIKAYRAMPDDLKQAMMLVIESMKAK